MNLSESDPSQVRTGPPPAEVAPVASNELLPAGAAPATPGILLRAARERAGLSVADLAARLRMGGRQIDALERAEYASLPTGTFLRGFVRNYARAVGADAQQAITLLEQTHAGAPVLKTPDIVVPSQNIKLVPAGGELASPRGRIAIVAAVMLMLAWAGWYWWQYVRPNIAAGGGPRPVAEQTQELPSPSVAMMRESAVETKPVDPAETPPPGSTAAAAENAPAVAPPEPKPASRRTGADGVVGFAFTGDCWVEVTDSDAKVLISRRFHAGEAAEAVGRAPLTVVVGNAQVARMAVNGQEFDLVPYTRVSVAHVTVK